MTFMSNVFVLCLLCQWWTLPLPSELELDPQEHDAGVYLAALRLLKMQDFLQEHHPPQQGKIGECTSYYIYHNLNYPVGHHLFLSLC